MPKTENISKILYDHAATVPLYIGTRVRAYEATIMPICHGHWQHFLYSPFHHKTRHKDTIATIH